MNIQYSSNKRRCTVLLKEDVYNKLKKRGLFDESYSDLINRLLYEVDKRKEDSTNGNQ